MSRIIDKLWKGLVKPHNIEKVLLDTHKTDAVSKTGKFKDAVQLRRDYYGMMGVKLSGIPSSNFHYDRVYGNACENVIGYTRVPTGICGPVRINGDEHYVVASTTEGALLGSLNRGLKVINESGGANVVVRERGMTRSPLIKFKDTFTASGLQQWVEDNLTVLRDELESTTSHGKLMSITCLQVSNYVHLRVRCSTGNAMGMNMITIGTDKITRYVTEHYGGRVMTLSSNACADKKSNTINEITGRGKQVSVECDIDIGVLRRVMDVSPRELEQLVLQKCHIGSAVSGGTAGSHNAHAANIVGAIFASTGNDFGQIGTSSSCMTTVEYEDGAQSAKMCVNLPCLEIGTIGGGTKLPDQRAAIEAMGININDTDSSHKLAAIIGTAVLGGELSLLAAMCTHTLASSHAKLGR